MSSSSINPHIPKCVSVSHPSPLSLQPEQSHTDTGSVIHPSVSRAISHPSSQSACGESGWSNQSGQVMWVMKRKRQIHSKPRSHEPHSIPLWLTLWLLTSVSLYVYQPPTVFNSGLIFSQKVDSPGSKRPPDDSGFYSSLFVWCSMTVLSGHQSCETTGAGSRAPSRKSLRLPRRRRMSKYTFQSLAV